MVAAYKVHVYTRISKSSQQEGSGIDEQLARIKSYIETKPELQDENITYWQDIGLSAYRNKNILDGQLGEFVKLVESGEIGQGHALVIYSLDRLSRRSSWDEDTIQKVVKNGVNIHDVSTPVILSRDDPFSKIIMELIVTRGNNESKIKAERSVAGWEKRLRETVDCRINVRKRKLQHSCIKLVKPARHGLAYRQNSTVTTSHTTFVPCH